MTPAVRRAPVALARLTQLALLGLLAGLGACTGSSDTAGTAGSGYVSPDHTIVLVAPAKRAAAVSLAGTTLEGTALDVASLRGKVVVVNVWGSWCPPCRKEAPELEQASVALAPKGVRFVGINVRDGDPAPALRFQQDFGVTYPSLVDDGGALLLNLRGAVAPNGIPTTLVLDTQGRVAARITAETTKTTVVDLVTDVIAGKDAR
jgi:thiol-disulfide isomerase/thioredoxin